MNADAKDNNDRRDLDLSFLERQPARAAEIPNLNERGERAEDREPHRGSQKDAKTLTVARDITECDTLVVEGRIDATLNSARALEVSRGGRFIGTASVDTAIISGRFDGDLTVARALRITASGKVTGNVSYGRLEIEQGGEVLGDIKINA